MKSDIGASVLEARGPSVSRTLSAGALEARDPALKETDAAALRAIAHAAVHVELFTIPLYMTGLYSIHGMHPITSANNDFYKGRLWPGGKADAKPTTANQKVFNIIFSVFIQEMLHVQLAANMATVVGVQPVFSGTGSMLQDKRNGWICYGPDKTTIPHIINLADTTTYDTVKVKLGPLSPELVELFLAIEESDEIARKAIKKDKRKNYFPTVPFAGWTPAKGEADLPMFGTIGHMYQCYFDYLHMKYKDHTTLWDYVFNSDARQRTGGQQNDLFNSFTYPGHPMREYMGFETTVAQSYPDAAFAQMIEMMNAITDQGEGSTLMERAGSGLDKVKPRYMESKTAMESDYPSYTDDGTLAPSADAVARFDSARHDHYERFLEVRDSIRHVVTWPHWLKKKGNWTAQDLEGPNYDPNHNPYKLPTPEQVANALDQLRTQDRAKNYKVMSEAAIGAIAGVTKVLDDYWKSGQQAAFPFPSMTGSGDRMAICWAVFGEAPDLSLGLDPIDGGKLYHSCQALDFTTAGNSCAAVEVFHSCRGSNDCRAQGGCGFVQSLSGGGGGSCSAMAVRTHGGLCGHPTSAAGTEDGTSSTQPSAVGGGCGLPTPTVSAPGDNKCKSFGGCAVPISASQIFPTEGWMALYDFDENDDNKSIPIGSLPYRKGDKVYDVAYLAYRKVMSHRGKEVPAEPPPADDLRLAFPPST